MQRCETCRFCDLSNSGSHHICRRHPQTYPGGWAWVQPDRDWCGEHQPKEATPTPEGEP